MAGEPSERAPLLVPQPIAGIERSASSATAGEVGTWELVQTMSGVFLAAFLAALDSTLLATLSAPIASSLGSLNLLAWLASAYFIANAVSQPLVGQLTDIYGRKAGMIISNLLFGAGNLVCALAGSEKMMIFGRVIAGLGGGGIGPIAAFIVADLLPLRRRGLWQGIKNWCFSLGSTLGGPLGGLIHDQLGWRWAFWMQLPLTAVATLLVARFLNINPPDVGVTATARTQSRYKRVDFLGALSLVSSLLAFLVGLSAGGNLVSWTAPVVLVSVPMSAILLGCFVVVELYYAAEPIVPLSLLFQNRTVLFACLASFLVPAARFGLLFYIPVFLLATQGLSATRTGLCLIPEAVAVGLTSVAAGIIMQRTGQYFALGMGIVAIFALATALPAWSFVRADMPVWLPYIDFGLIGVGYSGMLSVTLIACMAAVEHKLQAVVTSMSYAFRSSGSTLGITLAGALLQNRLQRELRTAFGEDSDTERLVHWIRSHLETIADLPPSQREAVIGAYRVASHRVFVVLWIVGTIGALQMLFMGKHWLHDTLQRRSSTEAGSSENLENNEHRVGA